MGLALVPDLLNQNPEDRYEELMNELLDFIECWWGAVDLPALRIVLATCFLHRFTEEKPVFLWVNSPPRELPGALGAALGQAAWCPAAGTVAGMLKQQTSEERSLWVLDGMGGLFHRTAGEIEVSLRQLADIAQGEHEWHPRGIAADGRQGPGEPFVWSGRVSVVAVVARPLDRLQAERCAPLWPICQNTFVNVRFGDLEGINPLGKLARMRKYQELETRPGAASYFIATRLKQHIVNLMDEDRRDRKHRTKQPAGLFDPLIILQTLVQAVRGPAFDGEALQSRAHRTAMSHARMTGKQCADREDLALARRILLDALPPAALRILRVLPPDGYSTAEAVAKSSGVSSVKTATALEALCSTPLLKKRRRLKKNCPEYFEVSPELQMLLTAGF